MCEVESEGEGDLDEGVEVALDLLHLCGVLSLNLLLRESASRSPLGPFVGMGVVGR